MFTSRLNIKVNRVFLVLKDNKRGYYVFDILKSPNINEKQLRSKI